MANKYTQEELARNLESKASARSGDLTSFAAMLGDSFALKIDWLAQLLKDVHDPSLGNYKERLLKTVIADFIPKRYEVGTGFVLFPTRQLREEGEAFEGAGSIDASHEVSRQLLVEDLYAACGRPSIDPVVFFKLQLVLFFEDLRSERQLMEIVAHRLSIRWYLGYDLNEPLPYHSSLTRIRERYGLEVFRRFFEEIASMRRARRKKV